ncbi:MAG: hypothetical protein A3A61_03585 [Candidatus Woykebacteria bacterium RIFCSPLOWO2_01_FULL_43_14]|uniref:Uncharacterized protein n=1 Tax=Candidatus Woykebacteria bacterium RIFCSPLOWO2_01_FULL_43_14 TaxID=1802605 RepID=A0A1G1WWL9_9BACT|nr:MAG: hypothetical protein A3A61_03585 [Candidatus Woykebacteria bacterium RIFCSPLOWO2_01_FULL_43_14]
MRAKVFRMNQLVVLTVARSSRNRDAKTDRCLMQPVPSVAQPLRFLSNQQKEDLFTAWTVSKPKILVN